MGAARELQPGPFCSSRNTASFASPSSPPDPLLAPLPKDQHHVLPPAPRQKPNPNRPLIPHPTPGAQQPRSQGEAAGNRDKRMSIPPPISASRPLAGKRHNQTQLAAPSRREEDRPTPPLPASATPMPARVSFHSGHTGTPRIVGPSGLSWSPLWDGSRERRVGLCRRPGSLPD